MLTGCSLIKKRLRQNGYGADRCGHERNAYNSCANRHCPKCQSLARAQWLQNRRSELLNTEYFHVVFTAPEQIAAIAYQK